MWHASREQDTYIQYIRTYTCSTVSYIHIYACIAFRLVPGPGEYGDRTSTDDEATKLEMHAWLAGSVFESAKAYNGLCFYLHSY